MAFQVHLCGVWKQMKKQLLAYLQVELEEAFIEERCML